MARIRSLEHREYRRARERVLTRLAQAYPDQYKQYLEEEQGDEQKSKIGSVNNIDSASTGLGNKADRKIKHGEASNNSAYQGDNGGEA